MNDPWIEAADAIDELRRVIEGWVIDAEAELHARGIERNPHIPALDQLAEVDEVGE